MYELELQKFIREHEEDWEFLLTSPPYNLDIRRSPKGEYGLPKALYLFKYNQILSDMSLRVCQEARGIILDAETFEVVSRGFDKFFNHGEVNAAPMDYGAAHYMEKIDGSIIKMVSLEEETCSVSRANVLVSTNGTIHAEDAMLPLAWAQYAPPSFGELVWKLLETKYPEFKTILPGITYIFELVSPYNRVVVPYSHQPEHSDGSLIFLGVRANSTGTEFLPYGSDMPPALKGLTSIFTTPKVYSYGSLCAAYGVDLQDVANKDPYEVVRGICESLPWDQEGFVVVDYTEWGNINRVKMKGVGYLAAHKLRGETTPTPKRILDMIINAKIDDFVSYFPEYQALAQEVQLKLGYLTQDVAKDVKEAYEKRHLSRKEFAVGFATKTRMPGLMFHIYDRSVNESESPIEVALEYITGLPLEKIVSYIY